ncbi:MAG: hypothetical protein ACLP05_13180 [Candidatus Kryptoniota bacterium]
MKNLFLLFVVITFSGCASGHFFSYETTPREGTAIELNNDTLKIEAILIPERIKFEIKNLWSSPIKIFWDDATIVVGGQSSKIVHSGIRYGDFEKSMAPTIVPPSATYSDEVVQPDREVAFSDGSWLHVGVLPKYDQGHPEWIKYNLALQGDSLLFYLPIQIEGVEHFYKFSWTIDSVSYRDIQAGDD